jgi:DNA-binding transcriptional MerR regulator
MTGIPVATLRNWEQRYGVVVPARGANGHRLYSPMQVDQLRYLKRQVEAGLRSADAHRALRENLATGSVAGPSGSTSGLSGGASVASQLRPAALAGVPLHAYGHAAALVDGRAEEREAVVPFVLDGLRAGEQVVFLYAAGRADEVREWFGPVGGAAIESGQLKLIDSTSAYLPGGQFEAGPMLDRVAGMAARGRDGGYPRVRFVGEMDWSASETVGDDELISYESRVSNVHAEQRTVGVCVYRLDLSSPHVLAAMLATHPVVYLNGAAQLSPFFEPRTD